VNHFDGVLLAIERSGDAQIPDRDRSLSSLLVRARLRRSCRAASVVRLRDRAIARDCRRSVMHARLA
jgi:hypothetical protein